ncbi:GNAT family N-acetyltransferase [Haliscomenobacter hydrossis]|uniref:GCN5-related N-acetyltransferase n=1 Tax=Haliscomenobacter hydrossis (strain ATCC 27775 / DSM 1100 / LMG 10767 / O) TaxID=760192 RepID=F4KZT4_HALH1|nr:GNAT family N-acetyltransferase [Haliscomenobacter hydrossis]AEE50520.1 GCN5-related N-acetyltransferase [Haliscomenobacter hydrossis DSM 1100]
MISTATIEDVPALVALINSAYRGDGSKQGWTTEADLIQGLRTDDAQLLEILNDPTSNFLKYTNETGAIIGCVRLQKQGDRLYLGMLTVSPQLQAKGLGKLLLQASETYAQQQDCRAIFMTVFSVRTELVAWYERHGYHRTGEIIPFKHNEKFEIVTQQLEFLVLEKAIE